MSIKLESLKRLYDAGKLTQKDVKSLISISEEEKREILQSASSSYEG